MKLLEKILLATDFSGSSESAVKMALTLAEKFDSEIILLHVLPDDRNLERFMEMLKNAAHDQLTAIREEIGRTGVKTADPVVVTGRHIDQIIQLADAQDVNLVLIGSGAKERGEKFRLGTTAEKVVRRANKPVWVMKWHAPSSITRILCPVDFSDPSGRALNNAIHLARNFQAGLTVLTVIAPLMDTLSGLEVQLAPEQETIVRKQRSLFDRFLQDFDFHEVNWSKEVRQGKPDEEILKTLSEGKSDLLVMGTTGRTGLSRILMGTVTQKVVREVPCSFIATKAEDVIRLRLETEISYLETHFENGKQLLAKGFAKEALNQFQLCLNIDDLYVPAWEGLAAAHERSGRKKEAANCLEQANEIRDRLWQQRVEAEVRGKHLLFKKGKRGDV
jgi:nucleotide-binding universal stress UspA family protein